jgi:hypothetical protein
VLDAPEEVVEGVADAAQPEEAVAGGVGEGERVVDDAAVAIPGLPVLKEDSPISNSFSWPLLSVHFEPPTTIAFPVLSEFGYVCAGIRSDD